MTFRWLLKDAGGNAIRESERFGSRDEAEAWMGAAWSDLASEGADRVVLMDGEQIVYDMSLRPG